MSVGEESKKRKKSKKSKRCKFISFDEEIVSRDRSEKLLSQAIKTVPEVSCTENYTIEDSCVNIKKSKKRKREKNRVEQTEFQPRVNTGEHTEQKEEHENTAETKSKKRKKKKNSDQKSELGSTTNIGDNNEHLENIEDILCVKKKHKKKYSNEVPEVRNDDSQGVDKTIIKKDKRKKQKHSENDEVIEHLNTELLLTKKHKKRSDSSPGFLGEAEILQGPDENIIATKKKERKKEKSQNDENLGNSNGEFASPKKYKKNSSEQLNKTNETTETETNPTQEKKHDNKPESIRQHKRKKHLLLLEEKKIKVELALQQKALNYLSKWKYSRTSWKFEKLRQIWLQQNLFDSTKVPSEFWDSLLEYFTSAKGHVKSVLLEKAAKIIGEADEQTKQKNEDDTSEAGQVNNSCELLSDDCEDEHLIMLKRARDVMQYLQE